MIDFVNNNSKLHKQFDYTRFIYCQTILKEIAVFR